MSQLGLMDGKTQCAIAIEYVCRKISSKFPQYPQFSHKFKSHCIEEAFEEIDVLTDDFGEGFDESVILEAITEDIDIHDDNKELLCKSIHHFLCSFLSPPKQPTSLNLVQIDTKYTDKDVNRMRKLVSSQVKLLETHNNDLSTLKVLVIGNKNNFPLLTYLVDSYHRWRLSEYFRFKMSMNDVLKLCVTESAKKKMQQIAVYKDDDKLEAFLQTLMDKTMNAELLISDIFNYYQQAIKSCIHRNGLFHLLPLHSTRATNKMINDSLTIFTIYSISILKCVNNMIDELSINYPAQIDIWIIPENLKHCSPVYDTDDLFASDDSDIEDIVNNNNIELEDGLNHTDNLQTINITDRNIDKLSVLFHDVINNVFNQQTGKRMVMIIDRRRQRENTYDDNQQNENDILYAYLPRNTQNIVCDNYLYESMINLTKTEILPSNIGEINSNTINTNSDICNMFVLSLHIHKENEIALYWHYENSCTRFYVNDMLSLWPLYFVINESDEYDYKLIEKYIHFDELIDPHFKTFYEINTNDKWKNSIPDSFRPKPLKMREKPLYSELADESKTDLSFPSSAPILPDSFTSICSTGSKSTDNIHSIFNNNNNNNMMKSKYSSQSISPTPNDSKIDEEHELLPPKIHPLIPNSFTSFCSMNSTSFDGAKQIKYKQGDIKIDDMSNNLMASYYMDGLIKKPQSDDVEFLYKYDFDRNGLLYFLGTKCDSLRYTNPANHGIVIVNVSSLESDELNKNDFIGRDCKRCITKNEESSWFSINLQNIFIKISHYTLKHYNSYNASLRNWTLEGSNDGNGWFILKNHINDESLKNHPGDTKTWSVNFNGYFSQFRIVENGKNSNNRWNLAVSGMEIYGQCYGGIIDNSLINNNEEKKEEKEQIDRHNKSWMDISSLISIKSNECGFIWNVYPKTYKVCIENKGMIIKRLRNEFNKIGITQFMIGCSNQININGKITEFKIKYESENKNYCNDAIGITTNIEQCQYKDRWVTNKYIVIGRRYIYWAQGKIYGIGHKGDWKDITHCSYKWKNGEILTMRIDCTQNQWFMTFLIDNIKITQDIQIKHSKSTKYYPIISTQSDDAKFTIIQ